jgi:hypothetical protein
VICHMCSEQAFWAHLLLLGTLFKNWVNMIGLAEAVVSLVFGFFHGRSWVYKCTGMQAPTLFEDPRRATHIRIILFPLSFDIASSFSLLLCSPSISST